MLTPSPLPLFYHNTVIKTPHKKEEFLLTLQKNQIRNPEVLLNEARNVLRLLRYDRIFVGEYPFVRVACQG